MKRSFMYILWLVVIGLPVSAQQFTQVPDYTIHYSQVLLDGELGTETALFVAPKFAQKWQYQIGVQEFDEYRYNKDPTAASETVSQAILAAAYELPYDGDIMFKPLAGATMLLADHKSSNTPIGAIGLFAGFDFNYQLMDHVNFTFGVKHFLFHDIIEGTAVGLGIELSPSKNRQVLKLMNCQRCFSIFVGSYPNKQQANVALSNQGLTGHAVFKRRQIANIELYIGRFDSYRSAQHYLRRHGIDGSVIKLGRF